MFAVQHSGSLGSVFLKHCLRRNTLASGGPHVGHVEVLAAIVVVVEPTDAHAGANVFDAGLRGHVGKRPIAIVAVEILTAEVVDHVKIGPPVAIVVTPSTAEAVAGIVLIHTGLGGYVAEIFVPFIV